MTPFWTFCLRSGCGFKKGRLYMCIDDDNGWNVLLKRKNKYTLELFHTHGNEYRLACEESIGLSDRPVLVPVTVKTDRGQMIKPGIPLLGSEPWFYQEERMEVKREPERD